MAKDINSTNFDPKLLTTGFGLLRDILSQDKKQTESINNLIDPLNSIKSLSGDILNIKNTITGIAINVTSLTRGVLDKIYDLSNKENVSSDSGTQINEPIVSAINSLKSDLSNKDSLKQESEKGLKALGSTAQDLSKLISTVSNTDANAGKNLTGVLDSISGGVEKTNTKKSTILEFSNAIGTIGGSLLSFAGSLVLATPLLILGIPSMILAG